MLPFYLDFETVDFKNYPKGFIKILVRRDFGLYIARHEIDQ